MSQHNPERCRDLIIQKTTITPKIGLILGSGLQSISEDMTDCVEFLYKDLFGFPVSQVAGHNNRLSIGYMNQIPIACLQGRAHYFEGTESSSIKTMIRTLKYLGCTQLIITNAAGYLHANGKPGQLMLIRDHINLQGTNPLIGPNDDDFGPRFFSMTDAYNPHLQNIIIETAQKLNIDLLTGTYISVTGPMFETPAEIQAFRQMGADAVGMSTVAEVIVARHCGLNVAAISAITNLAAGLSDIDLSHEQTLQYSKIAAHDLKRLLINTIERLHHGD